MSSSHKYTRALSMLLLALMAACIVGSSCSKSDDEPSGNEPSVNEPSENEPSGNVSDELFGYWQCLIKDDDGYVCHMFSISKATGQYQLRSQIDNETSSVGGSYTASGANVVLRPAFGDTSTEISVDEYDRQNLVLTINGDSFSFSKVDSNVMPSYTSNKGKIWVGLWRYTDENTGGIEEYEFNIHGEFKYTYSRLYALNREGTYSFTDSQLITRSSNSGAGYHDVTISSDMLMTIDGKPFTKQI